MMLRASATVSRALRARRAVAARALTSASTASTYAQPARPVLVRPFAVPGARSFAAAAAGETEVSVPEMGDSITEGTVIEWVVEEGQAVSEDDVICIIETDKVAVDVRADSAGLIVSTLCEVDDVVEVGAPLYRIDPSRAGEGAAAAPAAAEPAAAEEAAAPAAAAAAPAAAAPPAAPKKAAPPAPPPAAPKGSRGETRVKMNRMRLRIAERLKDAQNTAAMLTTFQECDMTNLMSMRAEHKEYFEKKHGVKLGFMSAFVKASAAQLVENNVVNAYIDDATNEVVYRDYVDISVAVASPGGLVVPVLRSCQEMSFSDVEKTIGSFGQKARDGTMSLEEMSGGTFTISNGGVFGSLMGTPIINPPQSAILGMHATKMRAVVVDGEVVARPMMYLALTYDHRLIDGREAVTFLKGIANKIEDPGRMLLDI